ncbi:MAG: hypothetical protein AAF688_14330 [Bacteroidota bacterium]
MSRYISYFMILVGGIVAIYANSKAEQSEYLLIGGIVVLMMGIYRLSKNIPSKSENNAENEEDIKE